MAYNVTITEVAANVAVNESSYPVTVNYNAVQLDGVNVSSAVVNGVGNLVLTLSDATTIDAGYVVGPAGSDGAAGTDGSDGISITSATINGVGNLVLTLSDASTIDTGHVVGADGAAGADGADGADGVSVTDADVVSGNLVLTLSDASTVDAGPLPTGTISYTIKDSANNTQTISDGDTITFNGTTNEIDVTVSATDTVTVGLVNDPTIGGNLTVTGNLTVNGTTTTINSTTLTVDDKNIVVASGAADATAANGAGLTVDGAGATLTYNSTGNVWAFDRDLTVSGGTITATKISNWDTAYGWGDHSTEGYLTSYTETDPVFSASAASGIVAGNITNWNTAYSWGDHASAGYLTSYTETDPVFSASAASGIVAGNITNWNTAYSWGDHSSAGYLTSYTETNDLTSAVTWATVPDAYISSTSVTQHQAALSITESQISDLSHTTSLPFANITATPTTLSGYGITDGYTNSDVDAHLNQANPTSGYVLSWNGSDYAWVAQATGSTSNSFETISVNGTNVVADSSTDTLTLVAGTNITLTGNAVTDTITIDSEQLEVAASNRVIYTCVNKSGGSLAKGTPVYAANVAISGQTIAVDAADASDPAKMPAIGVLNEALANDAEGELLINGQIQGIDTQTPGFGRGDVIWVASGGGFTNTKPTGEGVLLQNLGTVTKIDTTNGGGIVMGAGRSAATPNLNAGNIFYGNVGNSAVSVNLDTTVDGLGYIKLPDLSVTTNAAGTAALTYNNTTGVFSYTPPDLSSYLTAETNDLTSAVTWVTVPDAYISQTSVTQHQAALSVGWSQVTSTPTTLSGYGITDALSSTLTGNIDMNGYYLTDSSQTGTGVFQLSKSYTDPVSNVTSYVAQIENSDLHIDSNKADPNLVRMTNLNTGSTATTEFRMATDPVTGSSTYNFGFMSMAGSGYAHPYLSNIDPGELFFSNFNGNVVIGTGTGKYVTSPNHDCNFVVKSALGSSIFGGTTPTGFPDFDAMIVDAQGDTTLGGTLKLTDYEEKINTGLATSGTLSIDPANGTVQKATLTGAITINGLTNASAGQTVTLILTQPSSGNYTLTSSMLFAGGDKTLSTASNAVDIMTIFYDGSTYYASLSRGFA